VTDLDETHIEGIDNSIMDDYHGPTEPMSPFRPMGLDNGHYGDFGGEDYVSPPPMPVIMGGLCMAAQLSLERPTTTHHPQLQL
jgi:hypothetical protein